ncbi:hypothetical protein [Ferruginibacter sp.]|nr:hypothetical protein [Ferruginibacter sp.]
MIIDDSNNIYERILTVYSKENNTDSISKIPTKQLQFFTEGGQMIAELENHIAFKATYTDGTPAMANGQIVEVERNKVVDTFFTNGSGLGTIILSPLPRKNYIAVWKDENGIIKQTPLPINNRYGVTFHAAIISNELQYSIAKNKTSDSLSTLHLIAQMGNYQVYKADLIIKNEMETYTVKFSLDSLSVGLMQLTLFDKYWNPLQQRIIFISDSGYQKQARIGADTISTNPKGKNTIEIAMPDTMVTNLSISVADINFYGKLKRNSIQQELLFTTQLKEFYLNVDSLLIPENLNAIDLIMLTHYWKKYDWQKLVKKNDFKPEVLDNYISLCITYKEKNLTLPHDDALNLIISNKTIGNQFYNLKPISKIAFKKSNLLFFDSAKVEYQMDKNKEIANLLIIQKDDSVKIAQAILALPTKINDQFSKPNVTQNKIEIFSKNNTIKFNEVKTIKEVIIKSKNRGNPELNRIGELDKLYTTGMFSGTNQGYQLNVLDDPMAKTNSDVASYVSYRVPGIKILVDEFSHEKYFAYEEIDLFGRKSPTKIPMFLDEIPVESVGYIDLDKVAYIKYMPGIVIGGSFKSNVGAIYVYTKKGNEKGSPVKGLPFVYIKGYNLQKEFIIPDYSDKDLLKQPDFRTTLYWNPNIIMDKLNNKIKIEYYNNDVSKKLLLTIEGVNAVGKLIHIEKIIE